MVYLKSLRAKLGWGKNPNDFEFPPKTLIALMQNYIVVVPLVLVS